MPDALYRALNEALVKRENAAGIVRALDAAGYVIVPKEPTEDMRAAGLGAGGVIYVEVWRKMIGAHQ